MTAKEYAEQMPERHGYRLTKDEAQLAADNGLVVITGRGVTFLGDQLLDVHLFGALCGKYHMCHGADILLTSAMAADIPECGSRYCKFFKMAMAGAKKVMFFQNGRQGAQWKIKTEIPHESFPVYDGDTYICDGVVICVDDLPQQAHVEADYAYTEQLMQAADMILAAACMSMGQKTSADTWELFLPNEPLAGRKLLYDVTPEFNPDGSCLLICKKVLALED